MAQSKHWEPRKATRAELLQAFLDARGVNLLLLEKLERLDSRYRALRKESKTGGS